MLAARPTVAVEVHPDPFLDDPQHARMVDLRGWLVRRLLEEGYDVAADTKAAHCTVRLRAAGEGMVVDAEGTEHRSYAVESGPDAVLRLEVLHRALQGAEQTCTGTEPIAAEQPGLLIRFVGGAQDDDLLEALAVVSQHAGVTLQSRATEGATLACIEPRGALAEVSLGPATEACGPPHLVLDFGERTADDHRRAARSLINAVRPAANGALDVHSLGGPPPGDPYATAPDASITEESDGFVPMQGPARAEMRLGASAGIVTRGPHVDALIQTGWRMGEIKGIGGRLSVSVVPSGGAGISVVDARLAIGPDWTLRAGKRGFIDVAALVGTDLHMFSGAGDVAFAAELPMTYAFTLRGQARLNVGINPGLSSTHWEHQNSLATRVVWERPAWRIGMSLGITHGWRIE